MKKSTEVEIFGRIYNIQSEVEPFYTSELASYVDRKMREVSQNTPTVSSIKIAILAALNIANDLFQMREESRIKSNIIDVKTDNLLALIEKEI
ncbi:MAG: cell division protein ZapA [Nitrospinae bacterium]|nr:cell division protein ZapA [Nitrospinota bacterium]